MLMRLLFSVVGLTAIALSQAPMIVRVTMRDGIKLSTNVFLPPGPGRHGTLLVRTPYGKGATLITGYKAFLDNDFAVVVQDVRGRYDSQGTFEPLIQEDRDGDDTLKWIVKQPWSDGNVGMLGGSYLGISQWRAALSGNPHLKAIFPVVAGSDEYFDRYYSRGGAMKLGHRLEWMAENMRAAGYQQPVFSKFIFHLPLRTIDKFVTGQRIPFFQETLNHPTYDGYWRVRSTRERLSETNVPTFIVGGWYDNYVESDLATFADLSRRSGAHRIVVGPWPHNMSIPFRGVSFGEHSSAPIRRFQIQWFKHWMRSPQPVPDFPHPPVRIFVMGANEWRDEQEWPLARTRYTPYYLSPARTLTTDIKKAGQDEYTYDPRRPVPTRGGAICCNPEVFPWGPTDQREVEARDDVLTYSTAPLKQDMEVTGEIKAMIHISTSAPDTDFTAKLVDVFPDGHARNLCDGILRVRYRNSLRKAELAKPGEIYNITIPAGVTSNVFKAGHRIRVEISSSNFPRFDRNPNTGRVIAEETELRTARQTVYYGVRHASHVLLPVIP